VALAITEHADALQFAIKAVPGASRDRIQGLYGDALKVQVTAAPEGGKANARIEAVLAEALGLAARQVQVVQGHSNPRKVVAVRGLDAAELRRRLGL
jgi:uncharacterized protein (TIGR00251 family)